MQRMGTEDLNCIETTSEGDIDVEKPSWLLFFLISTWGVFHEHAMPLVTLSNLWSTTWSLCDWESSGSLIRFASSGLIFDLSTGVCALVWTLASLHVT